MAVATQNSNAFFAIYNKGLADEQTVKTHLKNTGRLVTASTVDQDRFEDIDCFVDGVAVSIKSQRAGVKYGNVGLELSQHLTSHEGCATTRVVLANKDITVKDIARLEATGSWTTSWFINGKAEEYYIYSGEVLRIYKKVDILAYVAKNGYLRIRPLKPETKTTQGGKYRFCNALSGYFQYNTIPHRKELVIEHYENN